MSASRKAVGSIKFTDRHQVHIKSRNSKTCESLKREIQAVEVAAQPAAKERSPHPSSFLSDLLFSCTNCSLSTLFSLCGFFVCLRIATGILLVVEAAFHISSITQPHQKPTLYGHVQRRVVLSFSLHQSPSATQHPNATDIQVLASAITLIRPILQKPESSMTVVRPKLEAVRLLSPQDWRGKAVA